jgi:hypothetical protein
MISETMVEFNVNIVAENLMTRLLKDISLIVKPSLK